MLKNDTNRALWEEWWRDGTGRTGKFQKRTRSDAQTESVFPPALIAKYVFGLQATKPGMKEIVITKPNFNFKNIEGKFPTPHGLVSVNWEIKNKSILNIKVPKGIIAKIDIERLNNNKTIKLNHKTLNINEIRDGLLELRNGDYQINF